MYNYMNEEYLRNKKLLLFDVDGTLVDDNKNIILGVKEAFHYLSSLDNPPRIAFVSNQGGVGMRFWMMRDGFGDPSQYPTSQDMENRHNKLAKDLGCSDYFPILALLSYAYQSKKTGEWCPTPVNILDIDRFPQWKKEWRKPNLGMLREAMNHYNVLPSETLMIGNGDEDELAAYNASVDFVWDTKFFRRVS